MNCNKVAVPGTDTPSLLYAGLEQKYGEDRALQVWAWAHQRNWAEHDEHGEPTLAAVEAALPQPKAEDEIVNAAKEEEPKDYAHIAQPEPNPLDINPAVLDKQLELTTVKLPDGGYWEASKQEQVVDTIQYGLFNTFPKAMTDAAVQEQIKAKGQTTLSYVKDEILKGFKKMRDQYANIEANKNSKVTPTAVTKERLNSLNAIIHSFDTPRGFWHFTMERLKNMGIEFKSDGTLEEGIKPETLEAMNNEAYEKTGDASKEIDLQDSTGVRDHFVDSFGINQKQTTSTLMKMLMGNVEQSKFSDTANLRTTQITTANPETRKAILAGKKTDLILSSYLSKERWKGPEPIFAKDTINQEATPEEKRRGTQVMTKIDGVTARLSAGNALTEADLTPDFVNRIEREEDYTPQVGDIPMHITLYPKGTTDLVPEKNFLNLNRVADFNEMYAATMGHLVGMEPNFQGYLKALKEAPIPNLRKLAEKLEKQPVHIQNQFVQAFSGQYRKMQMVLVRKADTGFLESRVIDSNQGNELNSIINIWKENQKANEDLWTTDANGKKIINKANVAGLWKELKALNNTFRDSDRKTQEWKEQARALFKKTLDMNGIHLSDEAMTYLWDKFGKGERLNKNSTLSLIGDGFTQEGKPNSMAEALIARMNGKLDNDGEGEEGDVDEDAYKVNNPIYTEQSSMKWLAAAEAKFAKNIHTNTFKNSEGKTIYGYGFNTALSHAVRRFNEDPAAYKATMSESPYNYRSWLFSHKKGIELSYMDGLRNEYGEGDKEGVTRTDMSDREQWATVLALFQSGRFVSLTHSDKTTSPVFGGGILMSPEYVIDKDTNGSPAFSTNVIDDIYQHVFLAEHERMQSQAAHNIKNYDIAKDLFYLLPIFNRESMQEMVKEGRISQGHYNTIWGQDGTINGVDTQNFAPAVKAIIKSHLDEMVEQTLQTWQDSKLLDGRIPLTDKYTRRLLQYMDVHPSGKEWWKKPLDKRTWKDSIDTLIPTDVVRSSALSMVAMHYTANAFLINTGLTQAFFGDPAMAFKPGKQDMTTVEKDGMKVKQVAEGRQEAVVLAALDQYGKRLAKDIAPGADRDYSDNPHYSAITVADYEPIAKELAGVPGYEKGVAGTDAQELITTAEKLYGLWKDGKIDKPTYDRGINIIEAAKGGFYTFENDPQLKGLIFQAGKPMVGGMVADGDVMRYDYVKSSDVALYPPMTAGREIDKLRTAMETQKIDRLAYSSAKKIGAPKDAVSLFSKDGTIDEKVFKSPEWQASVQKLDRANMRIQQEIVHEPDKAHVLIVSQMNKNLTEHLATIRGLLDYKGEHITGARLRQIKEDLVNQMTEKNHQHFLEQTGADERADGSVYLKAPRKFYKVLAEEAATGAGYGNNDLLQLSSFLDGKDELTVPLYLAASASKFEAKMMSMIQKIVKIKVPGHSFVQASSAGFGRITTDEGLDKSGITWVGEPLKSELQTARQDGEGKTIPAQILVSSAHFKRIMGQDIKDFIKDGKLELSDDQKKMMQMVLARIPNQGHSSMLVAEIAGFLPETMADTMMVPMAITKQMGSDFDVDKVYTYNRTPHGGLENDYFDVHWSVLTHPEMYQSMMKPLDIDDAKEEAKLLADKKTSMNYFSPAYQMQDFQSMKGAKVLVGQTSLALTHNAEVQNKDLPLITKTPEGDKQASIVVLDDDGKELHLTHLSGYGVSTYTNSKGEKLQRSKSDNIQIQQSESVDHANNRIVDKLNLTPDTWTASNAISRLQSRDNGTPGKEDFEPGQALPFSFNARLLMQPIIREFSKEMSVSNDSLSNKFIPNVKLSVFDGLRNKYMTELKIELSGKRKELEAIEKPEDKAAMLKTITDEPLPEHIQDIVDNHKFNPEGLHETFLMGQKAKPEAEFYARQLAALSLYEQFDGVGSQIVTLQSVMSQNTRGAGANMLDAWNVVEKRAKLGTNISEPILLGNTQSLFGNNEVGTTYARTIGTATSLYHDILPYHKILPLYGYVQEQAGRGGVDMSPKNKSTIFRALKHFMYSHSELGLYTDAQNERTRLLFSGEGRQSLAARVQEAKMTWGRNDHLLARLSTDINLDGQAPDRVEYSASKVMDGNEQIENERSWLSGLKSEDPKVRGLFEDLIRYNYVTGGLQNARNFVKFIPWAAIEGSGIAAGLRSLDSRLANAAASRALREQIFQHNPEMARQLSRDMSETDRPLKKGKRPGTTFSLDRPIEGGNNRAKSMLVEVTGPDGKKITTLPDYVSYRDGKDMRLYKAVEWGQKVVYRQIDTLGDKKAGIVEYAANATREVRSLVKANRVPDEPALIRGEKIENKSIAQKVMGQVGLPETEGGHADLHTALQRISVDPEQPEYISTMAGMLSKLQRNVVEDTAYSSLFKLDKEFSLRVADLGTGDRARFDSIGNSMVINSQGLSDKTSAAQDIIHETMHYHTGLLYAAYEGPEMWERKGYSEGLKKKLGQVREMIDNNPDFKKKLDALDKVRKEAYEEFSQRVINRIGMDRWKAETSKNEGQFGILHYALSSPTEFIAHLFTHRQTMDFLNGLPANKEGRGLLERVTDALKNIWAHLSKALGIKQGSKMEEAAAHAIDILTHSQLSKADMFDSTAADLSLMNASIWNAAKNPFKADDTPIGRLKGKLEEERRSLIGSQTGLKDPTTRDELRRRIETLKAQHEDLSETADLQRIPVIAKEHLDWVQRVLERENPSRNELTAANSLANLWAYADTIDSTLTGRAVEAIRNLVPKMKDLMIQESGGSLSAASFDQMQDSAAIEAYLRSANQSAKNKPVQWLSTYIEKAVHGEDEEVRRNHIAHMELKKDMVEWGKSHGMGLKEVYGKLTRNESKAWGLVTEHSQTWDDWREELQNKRNGAIRAIDTNQGLTDAEKATHRKRVWDKFWADTREKSVFVDTRKFFDPMTGELKAGEDFDKAHTALVKELGADRADRLVKEAQEKYKKYVEDRTIRMQGLDMDYERDIAIVDAMPEGTPEQKAAKDAARKDVQEKDNAKREEYKNMYSPNVFFDTENTKKSNSAAYEKYVTFSPKGSEKAFWDERYDDIQKDAKLKDIYDRYKASMDRFKSFLPSTVQEKMGAEFLPIIHQSVMSDSLDFPAYMKTMTERMVKNLGAAKYEEDMNARTYNRVPIQHVDENEAEVVDRSKDLIGIIDMFNMMATHYKYASQAKSMVDMGSTILNEINKARLAGTVQVEQNGRMVTVNDSLNNSIAALKNMEDVVLYRKPKQLEGALGTRIYSNKTEEGEKFSLSPFEQRRIRKEVDRLILKRKAVEDRYNNATEEEPYSQSEFEADRDKLDDELSKYTGYQLYGSKIGDRLIKIAQLKAMSYNPFSAFANVTFGLISAGIHANGSTDFSWAHLGEAFKRYHAGRFDKDETAKITNMMDRLGIIGDYVDSNYGQRKKFHDEVPGWKHAISPFELMRKSDFYMKAVTTMALMLKHTVEVEENGEKKTITLYDSLDKNGYWDKERFGARPEWHSEDASEETAWQAFQLKAGRVNTIIHGNQDKSSPKMLNSYILGRLIMQFRGSWLPEGWYSRFQEERYDDHLDRAVKGRYRTLGGLGLGGSLAVMVKQLLNLIPGVKVDPFTGHVIRGTDKMTGEQTRTMLENSEVDIDNMKRNFAEAGFALTLTAMIMGLKHLHEKDDDKKWQYMMMMNTLIRTQQDINLYYTPAVFDQVFRNPIPAMSVLKDWGALIPASARLVTDDQYEFDQWMLKFTKAFPYLNHVNRVKTLMTKDISQLQ